MTKPLPYSDIDLEHWREHGDVLTDSLWSFARADRHDGLHDQRMRGWCIPQVFEQLYRRWTKSDDVVLDLFMGSGTAAFEAYRLGRRYVGVDVDPARVREVGVRLDQIGALKESDRFRILRADSASREPHTLARLWRAIDSLGKRHAQFVVLHPPYYDIIEFSDEPADLSNLCSLDEFMMAFWRTAETAYQALEPGRHAALIIGDIWKDSQLVPLGFRCMDLMMQEGFRLKGIVAKNIAGNEEGEGRGAGLWRYRALAGGYFVFKHEYVILFQKMGG